MLAAQEAARGSFETMHAAITGRCGPVIGKAAGRAGAVKAAADIAAFYAARIPAPCTSSTLLVISADSKVIVMWPGRCARPPRKPRPARARCGPG